jgi:hypothetical protein
MTATALDAMRDLVQEDIGRRGLRTDPVCNLVTACAGDFRGACESIARTPNPSIAIVTGFLIPNAQPVAGETDGPLGAIFLARALVPLGIGVTLVTDGFCEKALEAGLAAAGLGKRVMVLALGSYQEAFVMGSIAYCKVNSLDPAKPITHLIALERVGPSHTPVSIRQQRAGATTIERFLEEVPVGHHNRCHTMRGRDITELMSPAHLLFEEASAHHPAIRTIGIGDGGNEIGMGKIPWDVIRRNIPGGTTIACRVPTDYLIVSGISNWGAYALGSGIRMLRGAKPDADLYDPACERVLLRKMVEEGPLVDGVLRRPSLTVDGIAFELYVEALVRLGKIAASK